MQASTSFLALSKRYSLRMKLQKIEFFISWIIIMYSSILKASSPLYICYHKTCILTRAIAYIYDFINASVKFKGKLPLWLLFHHLGCFATHIVWTFYIPPESYLEHVIIALCSQSTHNTWTKQLSLSLYWVNVLVGAIVSFYYQSLCMENATATYSLISLLVTYTGIGLLVLEQKTKWQLYIYVSSKGKMS